MQKEKHRVTETKTIKKIAVINHSAPDGLARTVLDGLLLLANEEKLEFYLSSDFNYSLPLAELVLNRKEFINYAGDADIIFFINCKKGEDYKLCKEIGMYDKTVYIDGSETGKSRRYDFSIQKLILNGSYRGRGGVNREMLSKCKLYFRREKPYIDGIIPLPFGIESRYLKYAKNNIRKDIDFFCVFGQDKWPLLRKYSTETLVNFCQKNNFSYHIKKTKTSDEFYRLLARSKVGVSVGGGGYDTMRFWEILGNNCLLLTEKIDIYQPDSNKLEYKRIWQFSSLFDFQYQLERIAEFLRNKYNQDNLLEEYKDILKSHSSEARVLTLLQKIETIKIKIYEF